MIYVLYGTDTYRSRKKVREITARFRAVAAGESPVVLDFSERTPEEVRAHIETGSLFRGRRLVIMEGACSAAADSAEYLLSKVPRLAASDDVFVVWDGDIKTTSTLAEALRNHAAKIQEFTRLSSAGAARLLDEELLERGLSLSAEDKRRLLIEANGDAWRLTRRLEQCALGGFAVLLEPEDSERLLFSFTDACGARRAGEAWRLLHTMMGRGVTADRIFWALVSHVRTLVRVGSLAEGGTPHTELARKAGVHPFVAKKAAIQARRFSEQERVRLFRLLGDIDFEIKQGRGNRVLGLEKAVLALTG